MKMLRVFLLLTVFTIAACVMTAEATQDTLSWYEGGVSSVGAFPYTQGANFYDQTSFLINPPANGILEEFGFLTFFNGFEYPTGTMDVAIYSNDYAGGQNLPGEPLTETLHFSGTEFVFAPEWTWLDLSSFGFSFMAGELFHIVWSYQPSGSEHLNLLLTEAPNLVSGMHLQSQDTWGHWFNNAGDPMEAVIVELTDLAPPCLVITPNYLEMGMVETETELSTTILMANSGNQDLTIEEMIISNPDLFQVTGADFPVVLAGGESLTLDLVFYSAFPVDTASCELTFVNDGVPTLTDTACNLTASATAADRLINDWSGDASEPEWYQLTLGDTGESWAYYEGFHRLPWFAGHEFTIPSVTADNLLYAVLENPGGYPFGLQFVQNQLFPEDTEYHSVFIGHIGQDTLYQDYEAVLWDHSDPEHQNPDLLVWDGQWQTILVEAVEMPYSEVVIGFRYSGSYADSWYIDDVEVDFLTPPRVDLTTQDGQVRLHWQPLPEGLMHVYASAEPFQNFVEVNQVPAWTGEYFDVADTNRFYQITYSGDERQATVNLHPVRRSFVADPGRLGKTYHKTNSRQVMKSMR